jgi:hypothetical protein
LLKQVLSVFYTMDGMQPFVATPGCVLANGPLIEAFGEGNRAAVVAPHASWQPVVRCREDPVETLALSHQRLPCCRLPDAAGRTFDPSSCFSPGQVCYAFFFAEGIRQ